jgi:hypothetical protein
MRRFASCRLADLEYSEDLVSSWESIFSTGADLKGVESRVSLFIGVYSTLAGKPTSVWKIFPLGRSVAQCVLSVLPARGWQSEYGSFLPILAALWLISLELCAHCLTRPGVAWMIGGTMNDVTLKFSTDSKDSILDSTQLTSF